VYIIASIIKTTQNKNGDRNSEKYVKFLIKKGAYEFSAKKA